jgi:hypothetical protein
LVDKDKILVGDNPFHGISHLSEDRARARGLNIMDSEYAANLVKTSLECGASGFMFSVSDNTLAILKTLNQKDIKPASLYAIIPYAYEYVRLAANLGTNGLAKKLGKQILFSGNLKGLATGIKSITTLNPEDLLNAYLIYELSRIRDVTKSKFTLKSIMLHEIITEMLISLDLETITKSFIKNVSKLNVQPGFETRNFAYLIKKFKSWNIDISKLSIATPFNRVGFQMNPTKEECESALSTISGCNLVAMSVLASGYLSLSEAVDYLTQLSNVKGVVIGVSNEFQARTTFNHLGERLKNI